MSRLIEADRLDKDLRMYAERKMQMLKRTREERTFARGVEQI